MMKPCKQASQNVKAYIASASLRSIHTNTQFACIFTWLHKYSNYIIGFRYIVNDFSALSAYFVINCKLRSISIITKLLYFLCFQYNYIMLNWLVQTIQIFVFYHSNYLNPKFNIFSAPIRPYQINVMFHKLFTFLG